MIKIINYFILVFTLIILPLSFPGKSLSVEKFTDKFEDLQKWETITNGNNESWYIEDEALVGAVGRKGTSFILTKQSDFGQDFNISYNAINKIGTDQDLLFGVNKITSEYFVINVRFYEPNWPQDTANEVVLWKCFSFTTNNCVEKFRNNDLGFILNKNQQYLFSLKIDSKNVEFSIDNTKVLDYLGDSNYFGNVGFWSWGGDFTSGVSNKYDNFVINDGITLTPTEIITPIPIPTPTIETTPTPTLTPTPTIEPTPTPIVKKKKIFILPGLGASWNSKAIVYGEQVNDNEWKMTPFVNNYDGLIELLENNGLLRDVDFFVWNYDWRKSVSDIENKFNSFVESKNIDEENNEIYLIGHSLGGLVARMWAQDNLNDERITNVITLGSPHLGSLDSYSIWNGGEVLKMKGISSVSFQILLGLKNKGFLVTDLNKIRSDVPVTKDLLPTFDFVSKKGKTISWDKLESKNEWLNNKNQNIGGIDTKLNLSVGIGYSTPSVLKLGGRSIFDKTFGLWPDGELLSYSNNDGDGTVLKNSAEFGSNKFIEINSNHGSMVNDSVGYIADKLGLENKNISFINSDNFDDSLVVFIGSPVKGLLKCGDDIFEENEGFIVAKNKNYDECELTLSPTDNGTVHLVLGNTKNNKWNYLEKEVVLNQLEKIGVRFTTGEIIVKKENIDFLMSLIRFDLQQLKLNRAIKYLGKGSYVRVSAEVFGYRWKNNERVISQRILDNLLILSSIKAPDKRKINYKWLDVYLGFLDNTMIWKSTRKAVSKNSAESFKRLEKLGEDVDNLVKYKTYPNYSIVMELVMGYSREVLRN